MVREGGVEGDKASVRRGWQVAEGGWRDQDAGG